MIPNMNPNIRALYETATRGWEVPVVAWSDSGDALVPRDDGWLVEVDKLSTSFVRLVGVHAKDYPRATEAAS